MALINELEKQGNFLFRYRGQFPVLLFFLAIPFLYWTELELLNESTRARFTFIAILISFLGFCFGGDLVLTEMMTTTTTMTMMTMIMTMMMINMMMMWMMMINDEDDDDDDDEDDDDDDQDQHDDNDDEMI